jgi:hypothetical protein
VATCLVLFSLFLPLMHASPSATTLAVFFFLGTCAHLPLAAARMDSVKYPNTYKVEREVSTGFSVLFLISLTWTFFALQFAGTDTWLANPALPDDILREAVPGNIRRAEHFVSFLKRLVQYLKGRLQTEQVESEGPVSFLNSLQSQAGIDQKTLKFCYDRLHSLLLTLEVTDTDEFMHIQCVCDFATLVGTYTRGFSIIIEPYDERMPNVPDPVLQACIDPYSLVPLCLHFTTRICQLIENENTSCLVTGLHLLNTLGCLLVMLM